MHTYEILDSEEVENSLHIDDVPEKIHVTDMAHRSISVKYDGCERTRCWSYDTFERLVARGAITLT